MVQQILELSFNPRWYIYMEFYTTTSSSFYF